MDFNNVCRQSRHPITPHNRAVGPLLLGAGVLLILAAIGHAQPFPSFLLDTGYVVGPDQFCLGANLASAFDDSTGLVVWNSDGHVKGCLSTSGRTLSTTACIDISGPSETFRELSLDVCKSPNGYLVVWRGDIETALLGAVVSPSGAVVLRETLACNTVGWPSEDPAIAFDGTNYLVAWTEHYNSVLFTRVSPSGTVLDWPPLRVCPAGGAQSYVSLSYGDSCYLAAYWYEVPGRTDSFGICCSRILPNGVVLDSAGIPVRHRPQSRTFSRRGNTSVAFDGRSFVVGWFEQNSPFELRAARVTQWGVVLDPEGLTISTNPVGPTYVTAASVCDTTLIVWGRNWNDTVAISGRRLSAAGELLDTADIFITQPFRADPSYLGPGAGPLSRCGDGFLVVYRNFVASSGAEYGTREVLDRRVSATGQVLDTVGTLLSYAANYQTAADVASDGQGYLAVWTDLRSGSEPYDCAVYGMRFSNEGEALDPSSFRIGQWGSHAPRVAYGAGCYLVSWLIDFGEDSSQVWAARIGRDGVPLDTNPIRIPGLVFNYLDGSPDVAFGDSLFLVVWQYGGPGCAEGARVRSDGVLLDSTAIRLETSHGRVNDYPRVASDGHDFLVVWEDQIRRHVCGLRVGSAGQVLDTAAIVIDHYGASDRTPAVAFGGGVYLVVGPSVTDRAWRVTPAGVVLDTIEWDKSLISPHVVYDGVNFLLVDAIDSVFRAMRISPQGEIVDSLWFVIMDLRPDSTYMSEMTFGLTADLQGHIGMAFPTYETNPYVSRRIRASAFPVVVGGVYEQTSPMRREVQGARIVSRTTPLVVSEPAALMDVTGRKLCDVEPGSYNMRGHRPGIYLLRLRTQAVVVKLVVVQ